MSLYAWIAAFAATLVFGMGVGVKWEKGQQALAERNARIEADRMERARTANIDRAATAHEKDKVQIRTEFVTITESVEHVVEKSFYRDECFDSDGLRELRAATGAAAAASVAASSVPGHRPSR